MLISRPALYCIWSSASISECPKQAIRRACINLSYPRNGLLRKTNHGAENFKEKEMAKKQVYIMGDGKPPKQTMKVTPHSKLTQIVEAHKNTPGGKKPVIS